MEAAILNRPSGHPCLQAIGHARAHCFFSCCIRLNSHRASGHVLDITSATTVPTAALHIHICLTTPLMQLRSYQLRNARARKHRRQPTPKRSGLRTAWPAHQPKRFKTNGEELPNDIGSRKGEPLAAHTPSGRAPRCQPWTVPSNPGHLKEEPLAAHTLSGRAPKCNDFTELLRFAKIALTLAEFRPETQRPDDCSELLSFTATPVLWLNKHLTIIATKQMCVGP